MRQSRLSSLQSLLIFALFWQRARRRKAEIEFGKSEQKFSKAFRRSPLAITIVSANDGHYIDVNEAFEIQTGWKRDEVIGHSPQELNLWVNPEQRIAIMKQLVDQANVKDLEVRFRRKDGQIRTGLGSAELIDVHGEPCALSVIADITERKQAEESMAGFSRRLIEAQETERTRIARELHDDINQRVAMVAITLQTAKEGLPNSEVKTGRILDEAGELVSELETDVQALSHRLHSSKLEYLGLEAATSGFCRELSERQNVKIDLHCEGIPEDLSSEVSLCLFRVLQEALHNAAKYSGVNEFEVALNGASHEIQLRVHDSGVGFDAKQAINGHGLGLTSMKERLRLVSGELSINSALGIWNNSARAGSPGCFVTRTFGTLPQSLSRFVFSVAYHSLLRCPSGRFAKDFHGLMFHKGCGIDIPADHFRNRGWPKLQGMGFTLVTTESPKNDIH